MAAILSLFLLVSLPELRFGCVGLQQEGVRSAELEEAGKLGKQVVSLFAERRFEEALGLARQALEIRERVLGRDHEAVASSLGNIADIHVAQQKYEVAEPFYRRSLAILEKKWGPESKYLTSTIESLALVRFALRDNGAAEKLYLRSLAIKEKALGPDDPETGGTLRTIGVFYERIEKPAKAAEFFKRSLPVNEKELGPKSSKPYRAFVQLRVRANSGEQTIRGKSISTSGRWHRRGPRTPQTRLGVTGQRDAQGGAGVSA